MKSEYFIGVDAGTQSTKTIVVEGQTGRIVGKATRNYGLVDGLPPGYKEQEAKVWIQALHYTLKKALKLSKINPKNIKAIGISGQQHGLVALDKFGSVIRPVKLWNDTSTIKECKILLNNLGGKEGIIDLIGMNITPGFTASKIFWLKRHEPKNYNRLRTILLPHDYLNFYLTGETSMEYGDASGTALMDVRTRTWCNEILEAIDSRLEEKLPLLHGSDHPAGIIKEEFAEKFGLRNDVLVSAGGGDNMMGAIGTGNTSKGIVTASLGTSGTIYAYSDIPIVDPYGEIAAFCDSTNAWLPLLCTMNVTVATEYIRKLFGLSYEELTQAVLKTPIGSNGLILLPYFEGERTPNVPEGTGVLLGLNKNTFNVNHFARAAMEGVSLGMNYGLQRMRELGINPKEIRLTGGGSKNKAWRQIAADVFNVDVVALKNEEGAAYGAVLQSLWTYINNIGESISIQNITSQHIEIDESTRVTPNTCNVEIYSNLQKVQNNLSDSLRNIFMEHRNFLLNTPFKL
jgi:xylulokinase